MAIVQTVGKRDGRLCPANKVWLVEHFPPEYLQRIGTIV